MTPLASLLDTLPHPRILVLGDLVLDKYTFGNAERVSPEAPVIVLRVDGKEVRLGGAASVAVAKVSDGIILKSFSLPFK